jgi:signal transduction histidine kinase
MQLRFREWSTQLDPELRRAISDPGAWFMAFVVALLVVMFAGLVPQTRGPFRLEWQVPALLFAPPFVVGVAGGLWEKRKRMPAATFGAIALVDSFFFQLFAWSLVSYSSRPGNLLMAAFPLLLAAFHGHSYQASARYPFQLVGTALAPCIAIALRPSPDAAVIFAVAAPAALVTSALLGTIAMSRHQEGRERTALKEALDAQILQERVRELENYREMVLELRAQSHDAGNTLSSALINSSSLLRAASVSDSTVFSAEAREIAGDLRKSLERLSDILSGAREIGNRESLPRADVRLAQPLSVVIQEARTRFPQTRFYVKDSEPPCVLSVYGGEGTLHRILSNLVVNACEGNGVKTAASVWVDVIPDEAARRCEIVVADDGPGFSDAQLQSGVEVFASSKPHGSGLGLYTVERLVAANQGALSKKNRRDGGAEVRILVPLRRPS